MVCRWNSQIDLIGDGWVPIESACPWESWAGNLQMCMYICMRYVCTEFVGVNDWSLGHMLI